MWFAKAVWVAVTGWIWDSSPSRESSSRGHYARLQVERLEERDASAVFTVTADPAKAPTFEVALVQQINDRGTPGASCQRGGGGRVKAALGMLGGGRKRAIPLADGAGILVRSGKEQRR